ncbi:hypothetical protein AMJ50_01190 [Parcubacteria bacterium DG_74_3]|nr:MAG: hypothetical protein AMJ50_01190 [Parcubacteria bacterium DG_74_3]
MKIIIKTKNIKLTPALNKFIREKIDSLERFIKIFYSEEYFNHFFGRGKPRIEAWVEVGKTTLHHRKGPFFWAECQLKFPKKNLRSTAKAKDLKLAITEVKDELQRELKEYKEKAITLIKRRARIARKELKISSQARFYRKGRIREEGT